MLPIELNLKSLEYVRVELLADTLIGLAVMDHRPTTVLPTNQ